MPKYRYMELRSIATKSEELKPSALFTPHFRSDSLQTLMWSRPDHPSGGTRVKRGQMISSNSGLLRVVGPIRKDQQVQVVAIRYGPRANRDGMTRGSRKRWPPSRRVSSALRPLSPSRNASSFVCIRCPHRLQFCWEPTWGILVERVFGKKFQGMFMVCWQIWRASFRVLELNSARNWLVCDWSFSPWRFCWKFIVEARRLVVLTRNFSRGSCWDAWIVVWTTSKVHCMSILNSLSCAAVHFLQEVLVSPLWYFAQKSTPEIWCEC